MIMDKPSARNGHSDGEASPADTVAVIQNSPRSAAEVTKLKEMMTQRNNEISILVKMLKREKKRFQNVGDQLDNTPNGQRLASQSALRPAAGPPSREGSLDGIPANHGGQAVQFRKIDPQLSVGKQEAFETFMRDHEDRVTIEDNKELLKQRSAEARRTGEKLSEAKNRINELKKKLALQRRHRAALSVTENCPKVEAELDPVEENLCNHIEQEKKFYKRSIGSLKALRTEIEHLQLLLERAKVKLQRDFHKWWSLEASSVQESEDTARCPAGSPHGTLQPPLPSTPGFCSESESRAEAEPNPDSFTGVGDLSRFAPKRVPLSVAVEAEREETSDQRRADLTPFSEWRALSTTKLSSSIPLTGDQQTDADILAFVHARQNLLNRTGQPQ